MRHITKGMNARLQIFVAGRQHYVLAILSGLIFVSSLYIAVAKIDSDWYTARDDGVITLSVARNFVDFGFFGVNPSGPIVEASSAPVQLFLYSITYWITHINFQAYSVLQSYLSIALIGALVFLFFRQRPVLAILLCVFTASILAVFPAFYEWQSSGMENALTNVLFLLSIYLLSSQFGKGKIVYPYAAFLFLASISRIEDIYHIGPLLVIFSIFWFWKYRSYDGLKFSSIVVLFWLAFMAWRIFYFGQFLPNTAYAQNIHLTDRIFWLLTANHDHLANAYLLSKSIYLQLGVWALWPGLVLFFISKKRPENLLISAMCLSLISTSLFNPFLFGPTRIDEVRTTSFVPLIVALAIATWLYYSHSLKTSVTSLVCLVPLLGFVYQEAVPKPYYLQVSTSAFDHVIRKKFMTLAKINDITRPTTSNPDLGAMTWHKQLNDIDLGMLGSPIMAQMPGGQGMSDYILKYAEPDFIEAHQGWVSRYCDSLFLEKEFSDKYMQYQSNYGMKKICSLPPDKIPAIYWVRRAITKGSRSPERLFLNDLQNHLSLERVKAEIKECRQIHHDPQQCVYIARTVYRFIPELRKKKIFQVAFSLFNYAPDQAKLIGWKEPEAYKTILETIYSDVYKVPHYTPVKTERDGKDTYPSPFRIYWKDGVLTYVKSNCSKSDLANRFYLHVYYTSHPDYKVMDFNFRDYGILRTDGSCIAQRTTLGDPDLLATGQYSYRPGEQGELVFTNYWGVKIPIAKHSQK